MNILLIGNGFDLAHGLPTSYNNALNWMLNDVPSSDPDRTIARPLLEYFKSIQTIQNWVDFESALKALVLHLAQNNKLRIVDPKWPAPIQAYLFDCHLSLPNHVNNTPYFGKLEKEVTALIALLDRYLSDIDTRSISVYPKVIYEQAFDHVINFNYTNTYNRMCCQLGMEPLPEAQMDFIHGRLSHPDSQGHMTQQNIVLGFDDTRMTNPAVMPYHKNSLRVRKQTTHRYIQLIQNCDPDSLELTIFGHSCDPTDGDILIGLLNRAAHTTIYYYDDNDLAKKDQNFRLLLGSPTFDDRYMTNQIEFRSIPT